MSERVAWEYKVIELEERHMGLRTTNSPALSADLTIVSDFLKPLGADGWELVSATPHVLGVYANPGTTSVVLWLKRPRA
jgi:hypothetical protein